MEYLLTYQTSSLVKYRKKHKKTHTIIYLFLTFQINPQPKTFSDIHCY